MRAAIAVIVATALMVSEAIAAPSGYVPGDGFVIRDGAHERLRVGIGASYAAQIVEREATWTIGLFHLTKSTTRRRSSSPVVGLAST